MTYYDERDDHHSPEYDPEHRLGAEPDEGPEEAPEAGELKEKS